MTRINCRIIVVVGDVLRLRQPVLSMDIEPFYCRWSRTHRKSTDMSTFSHFDTQNYPKRQNCQEKRAIQSDSRTTWTFRILDLKSVNHGVTGCMQLKTAHLADNIDYLNLRRANRSANRSVSLPGLSTKDPPRISCNISCGHTKSSLSSHHLHTIQNPTVNNHKIQAKESLVTKFRGREKTCSLIQQLMVLVHVILANGARDCFLERSSYVYIPATLNPLIIKPFVRACV